MELMIPLTAKSSIPLYEQIYQYIRNEIQSGQIRTGQRLPSTRALSVQLTVSRSTTQLAYDQLQAEGYIKAIPQKGYYVTTFEALSPVLTAPFSPLVLAKPKAAAVYSADFSPAGIDLDSFPYSIWKKITKGILVDEKKELFSSGNSQGESYFREKICSYLHSARGVNCHPDQIIIGAGNEYLLMLLHLILGQQCSYAMEELTYPKAYQVLKSLGAAVEAVGMDQDGVEIAGLEACGARVMYVMPSHQYPTGIVMPIKRRQELLNWADGGAQRYLIEDDYDSEFRYRGKPIPSLQGMDKEDKVIYMGTFSRSLAPAIRVSYLVLPKTLLDDYWSKAGFYASTVSRIDQNILSEFLDRGHYERHLNRMRGIYKNKREELLAALRCLEPYFEVRGDAAGVHVLLTHKTGKTEQWLISQAAKKRIRVYGLSQNRIGSSKKPQELSTVLLGYANLSIDQMKTAIGQLCQVWCQELKYDRGAFSEQS